MSKNSNILSTIGLCKRAGKLVTGFEAVTEGLKDPALGIKGVILASELSEKTRKEVRFHCEKAGVPLAEVQLTLEEISSVIKKKTGILAVTDEGLYKSLIN